ncbi:MAG: hypothetical protein K2X48_09035 [Chitinophagaceae bacterium]|nr:hypothetical protein [Chitinophagaceae bacterium]
MNLLFGIRFQNLAQLNARPFRREYTYLFSDFDPTNKNEPGYQALKKEVLIIITQAVLLIIPISGNHFSTISKQDLGNILTEGLYLYSLISTTGFSHGLLCS